MSKYSIITTLFLLYLTVQTTPQFLDFFQSFNAFQPFQGVTTKRPTIKQTTKLPKYADIIFFTDDEAPKEKTKSTTTVKPRKSSRKPSVQTSTKSWIDFLNPNGKIVQQNYDFNYNNRRDIDNKGVNDNNRGNGYNNKDYTTNNNNRRVTDNNKNENNNNNRRPTESSRPNYNTYTTKNPLLNRPGVKPAAVDHNRPPITNRPVTEPPFYERPDYFHEKTTRRTTKRPTTESRPSYERPSESRPAYDSGGRPIWSSGPSRPSNEKTTQRTTVPAWSTERPVWSSESRPERPSSSDDEEVLVEVGIDEDEMSEAQKRRHIEIAEQKCEEYKSMKRKKIVALPLSPQSQGTELSVASCPQTNVPLIIGGKVVNVEEFPHMGLVGWRKLQSPGYSWKCGGSLVSEQFILTAGHCTFHEKDYNVVSGPPHAVQLGSSFFDDPSATVVRISSIIRHPKYKLRRSYHDVALIRLMTTVTFSSVISPACLGVPPPVGEPVIATGWGKTEFGGDQSVELRSVSVPIWDMAECSDIWGASRKLPRGPDAASQLCAGARRGGKDTCQGDSGGPAQIQDGCSWRVVAVTSVGRACGAPDTPALYATVPRAFVSSKVFENVKYNGQWGGGQTGNNGEQTGNRGQSGNNDRFSGNDRGPVGNNNGRGGNDSGQVGNSAGLVGNNNYDSNNRNERYDNSNTGVINNTNNNRYGNNDQYNVNNNNKRDDGNNNNNRNTYNSNNNYDSNTGTDTYNSNRNTYNNQNNSNNKKIVAISRPITTTTTTQANKYVYDTNNNNNRGQYDQNNSNNYNNANSPSYYNNYDQYTTEYYSNFGANRPWWTKK